MKKVEQLILAARVDSDNESFDSTTGVADDAFIRWAEHAQGKIQSKILGLSPKPNIFQKEKESNCSAGVGTLAIPADVYFGTRIERVEHSSTGAVADYYDVHPYRGRRPNYLSSGAPTLFIRQSENILLLPPPSGGKVRFTYQKQLPGLDIRRAKISAVTVGATQLTALTLDVATFSDSEDPTKIVEAGFLTIIDKYGAIKMKGVPVSAIDETTGVVTLEGGSFTFESGETATTDHYVCRGDYHTNVSQLPDDCEPYLHMYMVEKALKKDSDAEDREAAKNDRMECENEILEIYETADTMPVDIPNGDDDLMTIDEMG